MIKRPSVSGPRTEVRWTNDASAFGFNEQTFEKFKKDLKHPLLKKIPGGRQTITDPHQPGLRANIFKSGQVSFIVEYRIPGFTTRSHLTLGNFPDMSIEEARELAVVVRELGSRGVDVQAGLHDRLIQELRRDGLNWRPELSPPRK
jgi:hypothetical protein